MRHPGNYGESQAVAKLDDSRERRTELILEVMRDRVSRLVQLGLMALIMAAMNREAA